MHLQFARGLCCSSFVLCFHREGRRRCFRCLHDRVLCHAIFVRDVAVFENFLISQPSNLRRRCSSNDEDRVTVSPRPTMTLFRGSRRLVVLQPMVLLSLCTEKLVMFHLVQPRLQLLLGRCTLCSWLISLPYVLFLLSSL